MEDQLLRIFGGDRMKAIADRLKLEHGVAIESKMLSRMIESAQRKVEGRNYDIRKQLLEFDDVQNDQRKEIYRLRNEILESKDVSDMINSLREGYFTDLFRSFVPADTVEEQWDLKGLTSQLKTNWGIDIPMQEMLEKDNSVTDEDLLKKLLETADAIERVRKSWSATKPGPVLPATCFCRFWTPPGVSTSRRSMPCDRGFTCAVTPRSSPSRNTSAKPSRCLSRFWITCASSSAACS